jgi:mycothiol synthase
MIEGFSIRPATAHDAEGILTVGLARDVADIGHPDWTLDDVRAELAGPGLDLERDSLLVLDEDGEVVAYAWLDGEEARVGVHPDVCGRGIGDVVRIELERRAADRSAAVVRQHVLGSNDPARDLLNAAGYQAEQLFWRMVVELNGTPREPTWPDGLGEVRAFVPGADDRPAHALVEDAFTDIPGNVARSFDDWHARALAGAQFAPELSTVATVDTDFAGLALVERWDSDGYVSYIAVARPWRGRGLGRALLERSLANIASAGLERAVLSVNGRNESATRLYRSVGMDVEFRADMFVKRL